MKHETKNPVYFQHIDELKNLREELNWRVKFAYTSSFTIISIIIFSLGLFLNTTRPAVIGNETIYSYALISISLLLSMFVSIANANHLVEKRIEFYILKLQMIIFSETKVPLFNWLPFLYSKKTFSSKTLNFIQIISHGVFGFFIYLLPNIISAAILIIMRDFIDSQYIPLYYYYFSITLCCLASLSTISFFIVFFIIRNKQNDFYEKTFLPYFDKFQNLSTTNEEEDKTIH